MYLISLSYCADFTLATQAGYSTWLPASQKHERDVFRCPTRFVRLLPKLHYHVHHQNIIIHIIPPPPLLGTRETGGDGKAANLKPLKVDGFKV